MMWSSTEGVGPRLHPDKRSALYAVLSTVRTLPQTQLQCFLLITFPFVRQQTQACSAPINKRVCSECSLQRSRTHPCWCITSMHWMLVCICVSVETQTTRNVCHTFYSTNYSELTSDPPITAWIINLLVQGEMSFRAQIGRAIHLHHKLKRFSPLKQLHTSEGYKA